MLAPFVNGKLQNAASASANGTSLDVGGLSTVSFQITGTFVATVWFEGSVNGSDWISLEASPLNGTSRSIVATGPGVWVASCDGLAAVRSRVVWASGTSVTVYALATAGGGNGLGNDVETWAGQLGELRSASTAAGGTALTTAPSFIQLTPGASHLSIEGRNYSTAVVSQVALNPYLLVYSTANLLATVTDYSEAAQDADITQDVVLSSLDTFANGHALYLGSNVPWRGLAVDVDATNSVASVLTADYWNGAWTALVITDGTISAATTFAVDGNITWTVPTDWAKVGLATAVTTTGAAVQYRSELLYWMRLKVSVALDASTTLNSLLAMNRSTAYWELIAGRVIEASVARGLYGVGCVEARTDAGTANLIVNMASRYRQGFNNA